MCPAHGLFHYAQTKPFGCHSSLELVGHGLLSTFEVVRQLGSREVQRTSDFSPDCQCYIRLSCLHHELWASVSSAMEEKNHAQRVLPSTPPTRVSEEPRLQCPRRTKRLPSVTH